MKMLVAEDDYPSRHLLQRYLLPFGESHAAANGKEALDAFMAAENEGRPFDLICLDIMMPEMDGHTVLRRIREYEKDAGRPPEKRVKIIMTTARSDESSVRSAIVAACDAYMVKPIEKSVLVQKLRALGMIPADA